MKRSAILLTFVVFGLRCFSQNDSINGSRNLHALYLEAIGNANSILSANYEHFLYIPHHYSSFFALRAGFSVYALPDSTFAFSIPLEFSYNFGWKIHFIETSIGWTGAFGRPYTAYSDSPVVTHRGYQHAYILRIGYRLMGHDGILIRAAPLLEYYKDITYRFYLSFGVSLGFAF
jgi:hypothetical protein